MTATADPELDELTDPAERPPSLVDDEAVDSDEVELPAPDVPPVDAVVPAAGEELPGRVAALT